MPRRRAHPDMSAWIGDRDGDQLLLRAAEHPQLQAIAMQRFRAGMAHGLSADASVALVLVCALFYVVKYPQLAERALGGRDLAAENARLRAQLDAAKAALGA